MSRINPRRSNRFGGLCSAPLPYICDMMSMDIVATHHAVLRRSILPDFAIWRSCCNGSTVTLNRLHANISGYRRYSSVFEAAEDRGDTEGWRDRGAKVIFARTHTARTHTYAIVTQSLLNRTTTPLGTETHSISNIFSASFTQTFPGNSNSPQFNTT